MKDLFSTSLADLRKAVEPITPARVFTGRAGPAYHTSDLLQLRADHAQAKDAVDAAFDPESLLDESARAIWNPLIVSTLAETREEYLVRPDRGRRFDEVSIELIREKAERNPTIQIVIGDGLSVAAVERQAVRVLAPLREHVQTRGWSLGKLLIVRNCRVGIMNHAGELIGPEMVILLIGERPGLAVANSLGAYMAYRPDSKHTDANRNVISNIHERGIPPAEAALRVANFAGEMLRRKISGVEVKEPALTGADREFLNEQPKGNS